MAEETKTAIADFDWEAYENGETAGEKSREELTRTYDESLNTVKDKDVIEGTIIALNKREAVVNIGYKSDGIIPMSGIPLQPRHQDRRRGRSVHRKPGRQKGQLILSHKKARAARSWDRINAALANDEIIKGFIKCRTKGGMIVDVFGIEAFLPGSQIDVKPIRDYDVYVGKTMEFKSCQDQRRIQERCYFSQGPHRSRTRTAEARNHRQARKGSGSRRYCQEHHFLRCIHRPRWC